jgi:hypothetical protein
MFLPVIKLVSIFIEKKVIYRLEIKNNCVSLQLHCNDADILLDCLRNHHSKKREQTTHQKEPNLLGVGFSILMCGFVVNL